MRFRLIPFVSDVFLGRLLHGCWLLIVLCCFSWDSDGWRLLYLLILRAFSWILIVGFAGERREACQNFDRERWSIDHLYGTTFLYRGISLFAKKEPFLVIYLWSNFFKPNFLRTGSTVVDDFVEPPQASVGSFPKTAKTCKRIDTTNKYEMAQFFGWCNVMETNSLIRSIENLALFQASWDDRFLYYWLFIRGSCHPQQPKLLSARHLRTKRIRNISLKRPVHTDHSFLTHLESSVDASPMTTATPTWSHCKPMVCTSAVVY